MLQRLLADHDFNQIILRGLIRRLPNLEVVTAHEAGLSQAPDEELLSWAAQERRVTITHDQRTMSINAAKVMNAGGTIAGVIVVPQRGPMRPLLDELEYIIRCSDIDEWENRILRIPL